jgi:predicted MFS family arabinose efflux permease
MKSSTYVALAIAIAVGVTGTIATPGAVQFANAAPQAAHGTCGIGDGSFNGAIGCGGNVGGFILTPDGRCIEQNTPNSVFSGICP